MQPQPLGNRGAVQWLLAGGQAGAALLCCKRACLLPCGAGTTEAHRRRHLTQKPRGTCPARQHVHAAHHFLPGSCSCAPASPAAAQCIAMQPSVSAWLSAACPRWFCQSRHAQPSTAQGWIVKRHSLGLTRGLRQLLSHCRHRHLVLLIELHFDERVGLYQLPQRRGVTALQRRASC